MKKSISLYVPVIVLCLIIHSCRPSMAVFINGVWTVDRIEKDRTSLMFDLTNNVIIFDDGKCQLPRYSKRHSSAGDWRIISPGNDSLFKISITTQNEIFNGEHHVFFFKDEDRELVKMMIVSCDLLVVCRKSFHNYKEGLVEIDGLLAAFPQLNPPDNYQFPCLN